MLVPVDFPIVRFSSASTALQWGEEEVCFWRQLSLLSGPVHTVPSHSETGRGLHETRVLDLAVFALWGPVANHLVSANV